MKIKYKIVNLLSKQLSILVLIEKQFEYIFY